MYSVVSAVVSTVVVAAGFGSDSVTFSSRSLCLTLSSAGSFFEHAEKDIAAISARAETLVNVLLFIMYPLQINVT